MKKLLYILLLFPFLLQGQSYQLKPDVKPMFRVVYEPFIGLDSLDSFVVDAHDLDTAIVTTAIGFPPQADNYLLEWWQSLLTGTSGTGTEVYSGSDSTEIQGRKIRLDVPALNTNYAFLLSSSKSGSSTVFNRDTTQLDPVFSEADWFAGGILYIDDDTLQVDSIFETSGFMNWELDGKLVKISEVSGVSLVAEYQVVIDTINARGGTPPTGSDLAAIDKFMDSLVVYGYYARSDLGYMFMKNDSTSSLINYISPGNFDLTWANTPVLTDSGYQGNGSDAHLLSGWDPATNGVNYQRNSASIIALTTAGAAEAGSGNNIIGQATSGGNYGMTPLYATSFFKASINGAGNVTSIGGPYIALWQATRRGANETEFYRDGSNEVDDTDASTVLNTRDLVILRNTTSYSNGTVGLVWILDAFSDAEAAQFDRFVDTLLSELGL